ncbi:hypothetical protein D3C71_1595270 [compost metagenome]
MKTPVPTLPLIAVYVLPLKIIAGSTPAPSTRRSGLTQNEISSEILALVQVNRTEGHCSCQSTVPSCELAGTLNCEDRTSTNVMESEAHSTA